jgi:DNA-binding NtrC family response regulator
VLERLVVRRPGQPLVASDLEGLLEEWTFHLAEGSRRKNGSGRTLPALVEEVGERERKEILAALEWSRGNVTGAARRLRIPRSTLRHRIKKHSLDRELPSTRL